MPPRGDRADLTDGEAALRSYMYNAKAAAKAEAKK